MAFFASDLEMGAETGWVCDCAGGVAEGCGGTDCARVAGMKTVEIASAAAVNADKR